MALPTILVNSATGSDTQASGAGPSTALFGTTDASTDGAGTTVTLTAGTDLSGVATDGSHVIFLNDSTASAQNFGKITGTAGSGGATPTVTVATAFTASLSSKAWAIGGKRASIGSTTSFKLLTNSLSADARAGPARRRTRPGREVASMLVQTIRRQTPAMSTPPPATSPSPTNHSRLRVTRPPSALAPARSRSAPAAPVPPARRGRWLMTRITCTFAPPRIPGCVSPRMPGLDHRRPAGLESVRHWEV